MSVSTTYNAQNQFYPFTNIYCNSLTANAIQGPSGAFTGATGAQGSTGAQGGINMATFYASSTFTVPNGTSQVRVKMWGGGGGGNSAGNPSIGGGGGGAGGYIEDVLNVTPAQVLSISIGSGGNGGSPATDGGDTVLGSLTAQGGKAAPGITAGGGGGGLGVGANGFTIQGGDGCPGTAIPTNGAGGQGGSAGSGGLGGPGGTDHVDAVVGTVPGGGGGGSGGQGGSHTVGKNGANGALVLYY